MTSSTRATSKKSCIRILCAALCLQFLCLPVFAVSTKQFVAAVNANDIDKVRKYIAKDASNETLSEGLRHAISAGNTAIFDLLIDRVVPTQDHRDSAAWFNRPELARRLHEKGATMTDLDKYIDVVRNRPADAQGLNPAEEQGLILLEVGAGLTGQARIEGLELVSSKGGELVFKKYESSRGMTALAAAAERKFHRLAKALLAKGADPNVLVTYEAGGQKGTFMSIEGLMVGGTTTLCCFTEEVVTRPARAPALILAIRQRDAEMVSILLAAGADPNVADNGSANACDWAQRTAFTEVVARVCQ